MTIASHCVGLTLPGMIELPGSFSGIAVRRCRARAASQPADVVRDLDRGCRERLQRAVRVDQRVVRRQRLELVRRGRREAGRSAASRPSTRELGMRIEPVPTAVPPIASSSTCGSAASTCAIAVIELRDVAGELLPERQRRRVLQMRAADLDDACEVARLGRERRRAAAQRGQQPPCERRSPRRRASPSGMTSFDDCPWFT
jgi:hypothetical protein